MIDRGCPRPHTAPSRSSAEVNIPGWSTSPKRGTVLLELMAVVVVVFGPKCYLDAAVAGRLETCPIASGPKTLNHRQRSRIDLMANSSRRSEGSDTNLHPDSRATTS